MNDAKKERIAMLALAEQAKAATPPKKGIVQTAVFGQHPELRAALFPPRSNSNAD